MARASAQVSHKSHSTLPRVTEGGTIGDGSGTRVATGMAGAGGGLFTLSRIAVGAGTAATGGSATRRSWSDVKASSKRRTRCSKDSSVGGSGAAGGGISSVAKGGRAKAASSAPLAEGREGGIEAVESAVGDSEGAGSVRNSLGGTAVFLRTARSVLLFCLLTLAWTPDPWASSSIPPRHFLYQPLRGG